MDVLHRSVFPYRNIAKTKDTCRRHIHDISTKGLSRGIHMTKRQRIAKQIRGWAVLRVET